MNRHLALIDQARANRWCVKPDCTTCGAMEFRTELLRQLGQGEGEYCESLEAINLDELEKRPDWDRSIVITLGLLANGERKDRVLLAWLRQLDGHVRLADVVLFHLVRRGSLAASISPETCRLWLEKCIDLAHRTRDESLLESILYTIGDEYMKYPELRKSIEEAQVRSNKIRQAIQKTMHQPGK